LVGGPDDSVGLDAVDRALSGTQATLWYGPHCFEFTNTARESGDCLLRLEEVGRRAETGSGRTVMLFVEHGYRVEQLVAPCRILLEGIDMRDLDAKVLRVMGRALLADTARVMDIEDSRA
jgi:hypothetical protein